MFKSIKIYLIILLLGYLLYFIGGGNLNTALFTFSTNKMPFPPPTEIADTKDNFRIGVEKVIKEKYFITYSNQEGNPSYFGLYLIIENLDKEALNKDAFESISIVDNLGNSYEALPYYELEDFPQDQPLGWKLILFSKFEPVNEKASFINIKIKFENHQFRLEKVTLP